MPIRPPAPHCRAAHSIRPVPALEAWHLWRLDLIRQQVDMPRVGARLDQEGGTDLDGQRLRLGELGFGWSGYGSRKP